MSGERIHSTNRKLNRRHIPDTLDQETPLPSLNQHMRHDSHLLTPAGILQLQRTIGNAAVQRLLQETKAVPSQTVTMHERACNCASCTGRLAPLQMKRVVQEHLGTRNSVIQTQKCNCGASKRSSNNHKNTCPRHPANLSKKNHETQQEHKKMSSWDNLQYYDKNWVSTHPVTEEDVKTYCKEKNRVIHGHHSEGDSSKKHPQTQTDIDNFHTWYNQKHPKL